jgi:hypothetical protein
LNFFRARVVRSEVARYLSNEQNFSYATPRCLALIELVRDNRREVLMSRDLLDPLKRDVENYVKQRDPKNVGALG